MQIESPFLPKQREQPGEPFEEINGAVYLAAQEENPFGSLLALYIVAESPVSHVLVKLAGEVHLDPTTGQISSTFKDTPQLPFEELKLQFFGGPRASLIDAAGLRGAHDQRDLLLLVGRAGARLLDAFRPPAAPKAAPAQTRSRSRRPSAPALCNLQAGAFTPFTLTLARPDSSQAISALAVHLPPGIAAILASVTPCARTAGGRRPVRARERDRACQLERRPRLRPVHAPRHGLPHRPLRRRTLWPVDRQRPQTPARSTSATWSCARRSRSTRTLPRSRFRAPCPRSSQPHSTQTPASRCS